jgi:hypothetical protein
MQYQRIVIREAEILKIRLIDTEILSAKVILFHFLLNCSIIFEISSLLREIEI